jgi:hypothetical protein
MDLKRQFFKRILMMSALFAVWTAFSVWSEADAAEVDQMQVPSRIRRVMVLFSAETAKEDRDAFLAGLEEARLRHQEDYREIVRKWRESAPAEPEAKSQSGQKKGLDAAAEEGPLSEHDVEREIHHNPWFLDVVDVHMVSVKEENPFYDASPEGKNSRLWDMNAIVRRPQWNEGFDALIVVASDELAAEATRLIRQNVFGSPPQYKLAVLFAGVSSFDESIREPRTIGSVVDDAKAPYAFAIQHPVDPWPNMDLALSVFPKTKKVILLTPDRIWNEEKEIAYRAKLGPGKTLKTILMPEIPKRDVTGADIQALKDAFAASVKAEVQPDTVIVSQSSVETGQDPVSWLPAKFDSCPVFSDTAPARPSSVGGFCRSMEGLGVQTADLLEQLAEVPMFENKLPPVMQENDHIWLNEAALKRYRLKLSDFPESAVLINTNTNKAPRIRLYRTWSMKRILLLLAANAAVLFAIGLFSLLSIRAIRRKRQLSEAVYDSMPVRVLVADREGGIIDYHMQFGEVEQKGEILWKNINDVPWLQGIGADEVVREAFDSGKTVVREFKVDGDPRVVVLSPTPSDIFGRAAVIAVSSDLPERTPQV